MKKKITKTENLAGIFAFFAGAFLSMAQCPSENVNFTSQNAINSFPTEFPNCTNIEGTLRITGQDIADLGPLSQIETIGEDVFISGNNITSLEPLNFIAIGGKLQINYTPIVELSGFDRLQSVGTYIVISHNNDLERIGNAFNILTFLGKGLDFFSNNQLHTIRGFESLQNVGDGYISITNNPVLDNLDGLRHIETLEGFLKIENNSSLANLLGFINLNTIGGDLNIIDNESLDSFEGLENLTNINGEELYIENNDVLEDLTGIENVITEFEDIHIFNNLLLNECSITPICNVIDTALFRVFENNLNLEGCNSREEIRDNCNLSIGSTPLSTAKEVSIAPNPTLGIIQIKNANIVFTEVYNTLGVLLMQTKPIFKQIDLSSLSAGVYTLKLVDENGNKTIQKVIKK